MCYRATSRVIIDSPINAVRATWALLRRTGSLRRRQTRRSLSTCAAASCTQHGATRPLSLPRLGKEGRGTAGPVSFHERSKQVGSGRQAGTATGRWWAHRRAQRPGHRWEEELSLGERATTANASRATIFLKPPALPARAPEHMSSAYILLSASCTASVLAAPSTRATYRLPYPCVLVKDKHARDQCPLRTLLIRSLRTSPRSLPRPFRISLPQKRIAYSRFRRGPDPSR